MDNIPREEILTLIRSIETEPAISQRTLSRRLGISLGKTNYLIKELIKKGYIKVKGFSKSSNKVQAIEYNLTPAGIKTKIQLTYHFLQQKEREYRQLKEEWERLKRVGNAQPPESWADTLDDEWRSWYLMTPFERWKELNLSWNTYLSLGGTFDDEPDSQSPFRDAGLQCAVPAHGRTGMHIIRRGGI